MIGSARITRKSRGVLAALLVNAGWTRTTGGDYICLEPPADASSPVQSLLIHPYEGFVTALGTNDSILEFDHMDNAAILDWIGQWPPKDKR